MYFGLVLSMSLLNNLTSGQDLHWLHSGPQQEDISAQPRSPRRGSVQDLQQGALGDGPHHPRLPQRHLRAEVRVGVAAPQDVAPSQRSASEEKPREVIRLLPAAAGQHAQPGPLEQARPHRALAQARVQRGVPRAAAAAAPHAHRQRAREEQAGQAGRGR